MKVPEPQGGGPYKVVKVERAASKDKAPPGIAQVHLDTAGPREGTGWLEATDSYMAVRVPVDLDEGDVSGSVPIEALKAARKGWHADVRRVSLSNGEARVVTADGELTLRRDDVGQFPNLTQLIRDPEGDTFKVGLNVEKLVALSRALGSRDVVLSFQDDWLKPIVVRPTGVTDERIGLLMPIKLATHLDGFAPEHEG